MTIFSYSNTATYWQQEVSYFGLNVNYLKKQAINFILLLLQALYNLDKTFLTWC